MQRPFGEFDLIQRLQQLTAGRVQADKAILQGIGDDCARLLIPAGQELALTTDTLIAGVHFPQNTTAAAIAYKALAVNLSDLAAMGATPRWFSMALTVPELQADWLDEFLSSLLSLMQQEKIALIGGDTTRGSVLSITISALGLIPFGQALTRGGAQVGDAIYVTGELGQAAWELAQLGVKQAAPNAAQNRLNYPEPRTAAGICLRGYATAAIDISDGLFADLGHILTASQLGATIDIKQLPLSSVMRALPERELLWQYALTGGDDYELCFTMPAAKQAELQAQLNVPITQIGQIEAEPGLRLNQPPGVQLQTNSSYQHFSGISSPKTLC